MSGSFAGYCDPAVSNGLWVRDHHRDGYAEVVELTDMDSAAGVPNTLMVEVGVVNAPGKLSEYREIARTMDTRRGMAGLTREARRRRWWADIWSYGLHRDIDRQIVLSRRPGIAALWRTEYVSARSQTDVISFLATLDVEAG